MTVLDLMVTSADDRRAPGKARLGESLDALFRFLWAPGGKLLVEIAVPGRREDRLLCYHVDSQRPLWEDRVALRRWQLSGDGRLVVGHSGSNRKGEVGPAW